MLNKPCTAPVTASSRSGVRQDHQWIAAPKLQHWLNQRPATALGGGTTCVRAASEGEPVEPAVVYLSHQLFPGGPGATSVKQVQYSPGAAPLVAKVP